MRRIEADEPLLERSSAGIQAARESELSSRLRALDDDAELLPHGHPKWIRDAVSISHRAKALLASMRPIAMSIVRFWDHRARALVVAGRCVQVDPSGSYRVE